MIATMVGRGNECQNMRERGAWIWDEEDEEDELVEVRKSLGLPLTACCIDDGSNNDSKNDDDKYSNDGHHNQFFLHETKIKKENLRKLKNNERQLMKEPKKNQSFYIEK